MAISLPIHSTALTDLNNLQPPYIHLLPSGRPQLAQEVRIHSIKVTEHEWQILRPGTPWRRFPGRPRGRHQNPLTIGKDLSIEDIRLLEAVRGRSIAGKRDYAHGPAEMRLSTYARTRMTKRMLRAERKAAIASMSRIESEQQLPLVSERGLGISIITAAELPMLLFHHHLDSDLHFEHDNTHVDQPRILDSSLPTPRHTLQAIDAEIYPTSSSVSTSSTPSTSFSSVFSSASFTSCSTRTSSAPSTPILSAASPTLPIPPYTLDDADDHLNIPQGRMGPAGWLSSEFLRLLDPAIL